MTSCVLQNKVDISELIITKQLNKTEDNMKVHTHTHTHMMKQLNKTEDKMKLPALPHCLAACCCALQRRLRGLALDSLHATHPPRAQNHACLPADTAWHVLCI